MEKKEKLKGKSNRRISAKTSSRDITGNVTNTTIQARASLHAERENFRNSLETLPFGVQILSQDSEILYLNRVMLKMWGYDSLEELKAVRLEKTFTPGSVLIVRRIYKERKAGIIPPVHELTMIRKNGQLRDLRVYTQEIHWNNQPCFQMIYEDITDRKKADIELSRRAMLLDATNDGILLTDMEGNILFANEAICQAYKLKREQIRHLDTFDRTLISPGNYQAMNELIQQHGATTLEIKRLDPQGNPRFVEIRARVIRIDDKDLVMSISRDITDRKKIVEELKTEKDNYLNSIETSPFGIQIITYDGQKLLYANRTMMDIWGYHNIEEEMAVPLEKKFTSASLALIQELNKRRVAGDFPRQWELTAINRNGELRNLEAHSKEFIWDGERAAQVVYQDITERRRAEQALQAERENYHNSLNLSPFCVQIISREGRLIFTNRTMLDMWGFQDMAEEKAAPLERKFTPDSITTIGELNRRWMADEPETQVEMTLIRKDRQLRNYLVHNKEIVWDGQSAIQAIYQDITEQKLMEEQLRRSEEKFSRIFRNSPDPILFFSLANGRIADMNEVFMEMTGFTTGEVLGRTMLELDLWRNPADYDHYFNSHRIQGHAPPMSTDIRIKSGEIRNCVVSGEQIDLPDGKYIVCIIRDITELRKRQESLIVTDRLSSIGEMASGIAHELNNPLTSVIGLAGLLLETDLPVEIRNDVSIIYQEAKRTGEIIKNMLAFARNHSAIRQAIDINKLITSTTQIRAYEQNLTNIKVINQFTADMPIIHADPIQLQQVFLNLIINAEYFMIEAHGGGTLTITTECIGNIARISFADDGPGISQEALSHLFDPFYTTKPVGKGTGLGLSICYGIITEHGGRIYVRNLPETGAVFVIELPLGDQADADRSNVGKMG